MPGPVALNAMPFPPITGLIYGNTGVGKTVLACGSQYLRTFLINVEKGTLSLQSRKTDEKLIEAGYPPLKRELIQVYNVDNYAEFEQALEYFDMYRNYFDLVVVDTATELQRIVVDEKMRANKHVVPDQRDWGMGLIAMEYLTRAFRDCGKHVLMLAHEVQRTDSNTLVTQYRASFKGQFADNYQRQFSWIGRYFMVQQMVPGPTGQPTPHMYRLVQSQLDPTTDAKDRSSALDKYEPPLLDHIFGKIINATTGG